jgi:predicted glycoside hydrolase/deacetylase ChbG (UPF0249 family)
MRFRVNADDLGLTGRVNEESFALISRGLVDSASILANGPASAAAMTLARQQENCRFGVHLNITQFKPLRPGAGLAPVLDSEGCFAFNILWQVRKTRSLRRAVYLEWSAQIERLLDAGLRPSHIDSHHDVHLIPEFFPLVKRLQWQFGIPSVRRRNNLHISRRKIRRVIRDELWAVASRISGSEICDFVGTLNDFRHLVDSGAWAPGRVRARFVELIVHPGNDFDRVFDEETEMLRSGWLTEVRALHGASPVSPQRRVFTSWPECLSG